MSSVAAPGPVSGGECSLTAQAKSSMLCFLVTRMRPERSCECVFTQHMSFCRRWEGFFSSAATRREPVRRASANIASSSEKVGLCFSRESRRTLSSHALTAEAQRIADARPRQMQIASEVELIVLATVPLMFQMVIGRIFGLPKRGGSCAHDSAARGQG